MAITGIHAMFFSPEAEALRAFIRDKLQLPFTDTGGGWLIFDGLPAEIGCHPTEEGKKAFHDISFYCDDLDATMADLKSRGVEFDAEVSEEGWGKRTHFTMPGGIGVDLYQPRYALDGAGKESA